MRRSAALAASITRVAGLAGACSDSTVPDSKRQYLSSQVFRAERIPSLYAAERTAAP